MKKTSKFLTIGAVACILALSTNNFASAAKAPAGFKVAVVDIQKVVENSPQINALKTQQKNKITELVTFVENAKASLTKETNEAKKKTLEEGYNKELNVKKAEIDRDFAVKLTDIDKSIKFIIKAKSTGYDLVLTKNSVLEGGVDITNEVIKALK